MIKTLQKRTIVLAALLMIPLSSCNSNDDSDLDSNSDCEGAICTTILVRVMVSITDQNQNPVALDSFKVINLENGKDITVSLTSSELEGLQEFGQYPLIEDGILGFNQEQNIQFKGFINNQEVVSSDYTVGTDCCHVGLVSGDIALTL